MALKNRQPGKCIYPCPCSQHCGEASLFSKDKELKSSVGQNGIAGYDIVYLAHTDTKRIFMFGNAAGFCQGSSFKEGDSVLHEKSYAQASSGKMAVYEWSMDQEGKTVYFQSTLIPLLDEKGQISNVLGLVKNITPWASKEYHVPASVFKEVGGHSFSQILLAAREEEKKNISKALHDEIGSAAVILTSLLSMVKDSVHEGNKKQALSDISKLDLQIKESIERVKNIIVSLRPPHLESVGLRGAAEELLSNVGAYSGIKHKLIVEESDDIPVSPNVEIMLYRVIQEGLNNIVKHAQAKHIRVEFKKETYQVHLRIIDDGIGFKPPRQRSIRQVGLLAMKDSVAYLGGTFSIKSEPGKGTVIDVTCPRVVYDGGKQK